METFIIIISFLFVFWIITAFTFYNKDKKMPVEKPILHVFGQFIPHDDVIIKGNKEGLILLRDIINKIIYGVVEDEAEFMAMDGEFYDLTIKTINEKDKELLPYEADWFEKSFNKRKYGDEDEEISIK